MKKKGGSCTKIYPKTKFQDVFMFRNLCKFVKRPGWLEGSATLYELGSPGFDSQQDETRCLLRKVQGGCGEQPALLPRDCRVMCP